MQPYQIGLVIPVYNHPHYIEALIEYVSALGLPVVLVNDGSETACTSLLRCLADQYQNIVLLEHDVNQGKGQAVMTGLQQAADLGWTHALQLDADGQHHLDDIEKFISTSKAHPKAMIIGCPIFDKTVPKKRLYGRYMTHIWVWINSLSLEIQDSMCGFRIYPLDSTIRVLNSAKFQPRMGFDSEILVRLKWEQVEFINVPTPVIYPEHGISHFNLWKDNLGLSKAHARLFAGMLVRLPKLLMQKMKGSMHG